jgi:hypothetical protein
MSEPINLKLWEIAHIEAEKVYNKPSAYKSAYIVKKYKELGGKFKGNKTKEGLVRWFKEQWQNQHGNEGYEHNNDIYRPTVKVNNHTPKLMSELNKSQIKKAKRTKSQGKRIKRFA